MSKKEKVTEDPFVGWFAEHVRPLTEAERVDLQNRIMRFRRNTGDTDLFGELEGEYGTFADPAAVRAALGGKATDTE